ncbi:MAG: alpha/beta hydrolase [Pseudomonadota bacterium]
MDHRTIRAGVLEVAYLEAGRPDGWPCLLGHGFPYAPQAYGEVAPILAEAGARVIVPYLRGYGPTRFLDTATPRSGEQAALGHDLLMLMDALGIGRATLSGYDWGGRACCILAALTPERVEALVTGNGYNIQNIPRSGAPQDPAEEQRLWYTYYFQTDRGLRALLDARRPLTRHLWRIWSPTWAFDEATFQASAEAFDNPDWAAVVAHSYRHRHGLVPGDPALIGIETRLTAQPPIAVPAISIDGDVDGVNPGTPHHARHFTGAYEHRVFVNAGHNLPQERPADWARAILDARAMAPT